MKNGIFNYIRGIAFCFVLSVICLFGRLECKANSVGHKVDENLLNKYNTLTHEVSEPYFVIFDYETNKYWIYKINHGNVFVSNSGDYLYIESDSDNLISFDNYYCSSRYSTSFSYSTNVTTKRSINLSYKPLVYSTFDIPYQNNELYYKSSEAEYDSTLGYLSNVKVKRASPFLLTDMSTDFTNIIDRFSWGAVTSGGSSLDGVDIRIKTFKNEDILGEVETHINCPPNNYNFDWADYIDLSLKDWVFGNLFRYEIYFRPTFGNKYGDYCYFSVGFPTSVNEQIVATLVPKYLTDTIQYVETVGNIDNFDNYSPPTDSTTLFVPNYVVPDKPIDDINKDLDDDNVVPPSSPSYTEITNNITIIQNGNENGSSLLDKLGDLLSFCKDFLTFIYNFINLILSPLSFLPSWLKSLLSMSIIAFIVICVIKTVRG